MRATLFFVAAMTVAVNSPLAAAPRHAERTTARGVNDPWEKFNRAGFAIEGKLDHWIIGPLAHIYKFLTPGPIGKGIHNLVTNLTEPVVTVNGILQLRPKRAADSLGRFLVNSTVGLAGLIDVAVARMVTLTAPTVSATPLAAMAWREDLTSSIRSAAPRTVRDSVGEIVDNVMDPVHLLNYRYRTEISISVEVARGLDQRVENEGDLKTLLNDAADPYATLRSTFLQASANEIEGEDATPSALPDLDLRRPFPSQDADPAASSTPHPVRPKRPRVNYCWAPRISRRPSRPCQISSAGSPMASSRARLSSGQGERHLEREPEQSGRSGRRPLPERRPPWGRRRSRCESPVPGSRSPASRSVPDLHAGQAQSQPHTRRTGDPRREVQDNRKPRDALRRR